MSEPLQQNVAVKLFERGAEGDSSLIPREASLRDADPEGGLDQSAIHLFNQVLSTSSGGQALTVPVLRSRASFFT